jgi:hypothetical protein
MLKNPSKYERDKAKFIISFASSSCFGTRWLCWYDCQGALVDESGILPCRYNSTIVLHARILPGCEQQACWWPQFRDVVSPHRHDYQLTKLLRAGKLVYGWNYQIMVIIRWLKTSTHAKSFRQFLSLLKISWNSFLNISHAHYLRKL